MRIYIIQLFMLVNIKIKFTILNNQNYINYYE